LAHFGPVLLDLDDVVIDLEYSCISQKSEKSDFLVVFSRLCDYIYVQTTQISAWRYFCACLMLHWSQLACFDPVLLDLDGVVNDLDYSCISEKSEKSDFLVVFSRLCDYE
jgi:hypothetical protein